MIPVLLVLALIGFLIPSTGLAIPSPDFIGPVLTWFVTMLGFLAAGVGVVGTWIYRFTQRMTNVSERRKLWIFFVGVISLIFVLVGSFAFFRYRASRQIALPFVHTTSTQEGTGPLSARVSSETLLVPTSLLKDVVQEKDWDKQLLLLDIREQEEREVGVIDASTTWMRLGDLMYGGYQSLPKDRDILVICWNSMRGEEVARWLRERGLIRSFGILGGLQGVLAEGGHGWIPDGLPWKGKTEASEIVEVFEQGRTLTLAEARSFHETGAVVMDVRPEERFAAGHVVGALSLPLERGSSEMVSSVISSLPRNKPIVIYSDEEISDFYGKVLDLRLRRLGYQVAGMVRDEMRTWIKQ
jgi:rhodanese-related sulfurtransferase